MRDLLSERKLAGGDRIAINSQPILGNFKIPLLIASQLYLAGVLFLCTSTRAGVYIKDSIEVIIVQSDSGLRRTSVMMNTRGGMWNPIRCSYLPCSWVTATWAPRVQAPHAVTQLHGGQLQWSLVRCARAREQLRRHWSSAGRWRGLSPWPASVSLSLL